MKKTKTKSKPTTVAKSPEGEGLGASPVRKSSVNLNDTVRFKITPTGWQYIGKVNATDPIYSRYPMRFKVDERGFSEAQLWSVMQFFGPAISLGGMPPIETEIYFPNDALCESAGRKKTHESGRDVAAPSDSQQQMAMPPSVGNAHNNTKNK